MNEASKTRKFWIEAALWAMLMVILAGGIGYIAAHNHYIRFILFSILITGWSYGHQRLEWRERRRRKVSEKASLAANSAEISPADDSSGLGRNIGL